MSDLSELADELVENGMPDIADALRELGPEHALALVDEAMPEAQADPEGWLAGNLEVARERIEHAINERSKA